MKAEQSWVKMKKLAKSFVIVMNVFYWVSIAAVIIAICAAIARPFIPKEFFTAKYFADGNTSFNLVGGLRYNLADHTLPPNADFSRFITSVIGAVFLYGLVLARIFAQIRDILKTVVTGTPFEERNYMRLVNVSVLLMCGSILFNTINAFVTMNLLDALGIYSFDYVISIDMFVLFAGILMLIIAGVFKYGAYLQSEYDTTL